MCHILRTELLSLAVIAWLGGFSHSNSVIANAINFEVKVTESVELPCNSAAGKIGEISILKWYKAETNGNVEIINWDAEHTKESVKDMTLNVTTMALNIKNAKLQSTGKFLCEGMSQSAANETGTVLFEDTVHLNVIDVPSAPPEAPKMLVQDDTGILITWTESLVTNNSPILGYYIQNSFKMFNTTEYIRSNKTTFLLGGLDPYTSYRVRVKAHNKAGSGPYSNFSDTARTKTATPGILAKPVLTNVTTTSRSIYLEFKAPSKMINGELQGYVITYSKIDGPNKTADIPANHTGIQMYNISNLLPYTRYKIYIKIYNNHNINGKNEGPEQFYSPVTAEDVPSKPLIIDVSNQTSNSFDVKWKPPEERNGIIMYYMIYWAPQVGPMNNERVYGARNERPVIKYQIKGLDPDTKYFIQVCAATRVGCGNNSDIIKGHTDLAEPFPPSFVNVTSNSSTGIVVTWKRPVNVASVNFYRVMYELLSVDGEAVTTNKLLVPVSDTDTNHTSYIEGLTKFGKYNVSVSGGINGLFTEKVLWGNYSIPKTIMLMNSAVVPAEEPTANRGMVGAIIGVVLTFILLVVLVIGFILVRHQMKKKQQEYTEVEQAVDLVPIANTYATRRRSIRSDTPPKRDNISLDDFEDHLIKNHSDGDLGFSQEFDDINQNTRTDLTSKHSLEQDNRNKNRYINILAYDHSRVILKPSLGSSHSDYMNGNYIEGYEKPRAYIATQGPLPNTFSDFWRMVWEQNSAVIIMITNLTEKGRRKCDQYWPHEGEHVYNSVQVKLEEEHTTAHYILRKFKIKHFKERMTIRKKSNIEREVLQFHFTEWPDHGVPNYSLPVLQFIFKSVAAVPENSGPPIIHCSAGVGRTGTYIVIDTMMRQINAKQTVNVFSFLSHIRNQRNYMVQTEDQYVFIHDALLEYIHSGETEVKDFSITQYVKDLIKRHHQEGSLLEKQFNLVTAFKPKEYDLFSSSQPVNQDKIRSKYILPEERSRVRLPMKPGVPGSDYINAAFFQGYNKTEEFIVTQHPLEGTVEDFWRMVWDQNSMTIVLLTDLTACENDEEEYKEFWPKKDEDKEYGSFLITFTGDTQNGNMLCRDFLLQSTQDDYECTTRLISTTTPWPKSCTPLHSAFDLVTDVKQWHSQHEVEGPIVVVDSRKVHSVPSHLYKSFEFVAPTCGMDFLTKFVLPVQQIVSKVNLRYGGKEAATFCALSTILDQLEKEHYIDVYLTAKLYHLKRPGVFSTEGQKNDDDEEVQACQDDYMFLYKAIESYYTEITCPSTDRDSGIGNGLHYHHNSLNRESLLPLDPIPSTRSPEKMPPPAVVRSMSRNSTMLRGSGGGAANGESMA